MSLSTLTSNIVMTTPNGLNTSPSLSRASDRHEALEMRQNGAFVCAQKRACAKAFPVPAMEGEGGAYHLYWMIECRALRS